MTHTLATTRPEGADACLVLECGTVFWGQGLGRRQDTVGELCFHTGMTGYQEILTDPSYARQIITFTFPHIGNTGANDEDVESGTPVAAGCVMHASVSEPSNHRSLEHWGRWLEMRELSGICGVDTRTLTRHIRGGTPPRGVLATGARQCFDLKALQEQALAWSGLEGLDLAQSVGCREAFVWADNPKGCHVVVLDYGVKHNILRQLAELGCRVTVLPCDAGFEQILTCKPDGVLLSNGPGDPAATGRYAVPVIQRLLEVGLPMFGICLGHQILALALGGRTRKMQLGHHGANHPVQEFSSGRIEITSQNHGFDVTDTPWPNTLEITHRSLFDGSIAGFRHKTLPVFSVQFHPEASPGPHDSHGLFAAFFEAMQQHKGGA